MAKLTDKQEMFCKEYLIDLNATQAAIRAGYSEKTAQEQGSQNLSKLMIQDRLTELKAAREEKLEIDALYVLKRHVDIDQMDILDIMHETGDMRPVSQWPKVWRQYLSGMDISEMNDSEGNPAGLLKKIKWPDKVRNLELLGKHVNVQAYKDKQEQEVTGQVVIMSKEEYAETRKKMLEEDDC